MDNKKEYISNVNGYRIEMDLDREENIPEISKKTVEERYFNSGETLVQEAYARAACAFAENEEHAQRLYEYASKNWFMFASPILSNGGTKKGLPISCYLSSVGDSKKSILDHYTENAYLSSGGGGIGGDWSSVRSNGEVSSKGNRSSGIIPFLKIVESGMLAFRQGSRRGSYAAYLDISHPEIEEFVNVRTPGGDINRKCIANDFNHGINIPDSFMTAVEKGSMWELVDPNSGAVKKSVSARDLWMKILQIRMKTGEPYLHFSDTSNKHLPPELKKRGLKINGSNLCNEIYLPTSEDRTAVCCLSSVNIEKYDEWRECLNAFITDIVLMLDNVLDNFIQNAPPELSKAVRSAMRERSLGLGAMGFHSFLQKHRIPFESVVAKSWNTNIFRQIKAVADEASRNLATLKGPAPDMYPTLKRNSHLLAVAPNATSGIICGNVSNGVEPFSANIFQQKTLSGTFLMKNPYLQEVLAEHSIDKNKYVDHDWIEDQWKSILYNNGSCQHLEYLSQDEKDIFKTSVEIDQHWVIEHAGDRQEFICQGQSINLFFKPDINLSVLHSVHKKAWEVGLKGLYYCRSLSISRGENIGTRVEGNCLGCEG